MTQQNGNAHCALCDLPGRWVQNGEVRRFEPLIGAQPRWNVEHMRYHFENVVLASVPRFRSKIGDIRQRLEVFKREIEGG
jgi:hypothetical protein